jgi:hypothetical protein
MYLLGKSVGKKKELRELKVREVHRSWLLAIEVGKVAGVRWGVRARPRRVVEF